MKPFQTHTYMNCSHIFLWEQVFFLQQISNTFFIDWVKLSSFLKKLRYYLILFNEEVSLSKFRVLGYQVFFSITNYLQSILLTRLTYLVIFKSTYLDYFLYCSGGFFDIRSSFLYFVNKYSSSNNLTTKCLADQVNSTYFLHKLRFQDTELEDF